MAVPILTSERRAVGKRLFQEFAPPFFLALVWALARLASSNGSMPILDVVASFTTSFGLLSFLSNNIYRVAKQRQTERSFAAIADRMEIVAGRLDNGIDDIVGYSTGGDSFFIADITPIHGTQGKVAPLMVTLNGKYPMLEISMQVIDPNAPFDTDVEMILQLLNRGKRHQLGVLLPNIAYTLDQYDLSTTQRMGILVHSQSRNGKLSQVLKLARVGERWVKATRVVREDALLHEFVDPDYPDDLAIDANWGGFGGRTSS